ncbi:alpha-2-HS-glycoprotein-like [Dendropsophus ebraccatus]|uniref:alpha-2-HS-glycoprotein-like n=1 Tax=Dendropsophus ebraccatus TaxID=150705 RepID=UPI0038319522
MKLLIVLAPLLLCWSVASFPHRPTGRVVNCDDAEAHEAAEVALQYINVHHPTGYKFTLNRVENVAVVPTASGEIFYLELDLLETKCPSISPVPVNLCDVRPIIEQAVEGDCDIKLQKLNGNFTPISSRCKSELDSAENIRRVCPQCSPLAPLNDTQVVHAVDVSLDKFNGGNSTAFYLLHEIGRGRIQSGISNSVHVEFVVAASNCTKNDASSGLFACVEENGDGAHFGACSGSVVKNQGAVDEDVAVQCTVYEPQPGKVTQVGAPQVPLAPPQTNVIRSHFHHNLHHSSLGPHSSESNSAEHLLLAAHNAKHAVKRSLTGEPVPPNVPILPLCPGRKIHF